MDRKFTFGRALLWRARIANALGDHASGRSLLALAFATGLELDVMTHVAPDLTGVAVDSIYWAFAGAR